MFIKFICSDIMQQCICIPMYDKLIMLELLIECVHRRTLMFVYVVLSIALWILDVFTST